MDSTIYWIWLQEVLGVGSNLLHPVVNLFQNPEQLYKATPAQRERCGLFTAVELSRINKTDLKNAYSQLKLCAELYIDILTPESEEYPVLLKNIPNSPAVLYCWGTLPNMDRELGVAMVGTRKSTRQGERVAGILADDLASAGAVVVSGGANGIDTSCLHGALNAGGQTVCVLGCGINYNYLMDNMPMRRAIAKRGAVISEYSPNAPPLPHHFPVRNRIMSGISRAVAVIEADAESGALITAHHAADQNRDIYVVKMNPMLPNAQGINILLREGAVAIDSASELLANYVNFPEFTDKIDWDASGASLMDVMLENLPNSGPRPGRKPGRPPVRKSAKSQGEPQIKQAEVIPHKSEKIPQNPVETYPKSEIAQKIYDAMVPATLHTIDFLQQSTGIPTGDLLAALTEMEIMGDVLAMPGNQYKKR